MKKLFKTILLAFVLLPAVMLLAACSSSDPSTPQKPTTINSNMITLEYNEVVYDGFAKEPAVTLTVNGYTVDSKYYSCEYTNNIDAGLASVSVTITKNNSYATGTATKSFNIKRQSVEVNTLETLNNAIKNTANSNTMLVLSGDITSTIASNGYIQPVLICPENKHLDLVLDLNGYSIFTEVWIVKEYYHNNGIIGKTGTFVTTENSAKVLITNSKNTGIVGINNQEYVGVDHAFIFKLTDNFQVTLAKLTTYGFDSGFYSNGNYSGNSTINASNCTFNGLGDENVGTYLASNNKYNFTNCTFNGLSAYYAKSGTHKLYNCKFNALKETYVNPTEFNGNGYYPNGSAICVDSSQGYTTILLIDIYGATFTRVCNNAYDIDEFSTHIAGGSVTPYAEVKIHKNNSYSSNGTKQVKINTENNAVSQTNN